MNGSENSYASALFFTLVSLGALLKIDDVTSYAIGAGAAILAAISLRNALIKSAQAAEENHQRMEVQFQQLRTKIIEASSASTTAMTSLSDVTKLLQDNLKTIREQSMSLDSLINLVKDAESITSLVASVEENSAALNVELEKISAAIQSQEKFSNSVELKKLIELEETNKANLQSVLKTLQSVSHMMKVPAYTKSFEQINTTIEKLAAQKNPSYTKELAEIRSAIANLDALKISAVDANKNLSELVKLNGALSRSFTTTLDDLRLDMVKLSARLDELNDLINQKLAIK